MAGQHFGGNGAAGETDMFLEDAAQPEILVCADGGETHKIAVYDIVGVGAENVGEAAGHTGAEIHAHGTENQRDAARHIFATVLAEAFDDREGAAIAHGEALAGASGDEKLAGGRAIKNGVSGEDVAAPRSGGARGNADGSPG